MDTALGWVLWSSYSNKAEYTESLEQFRVSSDTSKVESLTNVMNKCWSEDRLGVGNEVVVEKFESNISFNGDRYVVDLPMKPHHEYLPDNFQLASGRLKHLRSKLHKYPSLAEKYSTSMPKKT